MEARVEIIRKLDIYTPSTHMCEGMDEVTHSKYGQYFREPHHDFVEHHSYHFPTILMKDGSPWSDANRYLLHKLKGIMPTSHRTLDSIARDLAGFRRWLDKENINYLHIPENTWGKTTYLYCSHLHDEVRLKNIALGTAKKKMSSIQGFYRWLKLDGNKFEYPLWRENDAYILFKDQYGFNRSKNISRTDLSSSFRTLKNTNNFSEYIEDGGKLRPLPKDEQVAIVKALKDIGNIEMTLSFLIALTTGARLQTVFTLRRCNFAKSLPEMTSYRNIKIGKNTLVNTKFGKSMTILMPGWLYIRIKIYLNSERCKKRVNNCQHIYSTEGEQYAFISRNGRPYYMSKNDPFESIYRTPPRGNGITQFIRQQLQPSLEKYGNIFEFRFHDLRATFGMNLLEEKINTENIQLTSDRNSPEYFRVLMYIKERMGHSNIKTTIAYLNYKENYKIASQIQNQFEEYLENLMKD